MRLSPGGSDLSASVPDIAVDPRDPARVAVIWRTLVMAETPATPGYRAMQCHLSLSADGGQTFSTVALRWDVADMPVCNAPFVDIGAGGALLIGATLAGVLPQDAEAHHAMAAGRVVMRLSRDWGASWSPVSTAIATGDTARFVANPAVPVAATLVPWDGARGVIDPETGRITLSGGFPAPPGDALHSQRFYAQSGDGGKSWGLIRAFGAPGWPQRWDGHLLAAHGRLAISYLAGAAPGHEDGCLCVVFATGTPDGAGFERHLVTVADGFDSLVHYPPIAAHPGRAGVYALALVPGGRESPAVRITADGGETWREIAAPAAPPEGIVRASRPALAFAPGGTLVLMWRGYRADGSYDSYVAAAREGGAFGPAVKLSSEPSAIPEALAKDYAARGDFINVVAVGPDAVHAAWTDWRSGETGQVFYGRVPLAALVAAHN
ncbi:sialidase family protein [Sphingomonas canadensis]|uniref:Sialidase family protein n=1 Tax=Sphingomonas canadensis TaxID=1219257 RepID=A0ABW3HCI3_9SPHN|nr:sialidase family protein [Sphingomonas canadensis]MCW3836984.1 glycoside hydrolase [Sphingomonas canadensis]